MRINVTIIISLIAAVAKILKSTESCEKCIPYDLQKIFSLGLYLYFFHAFVHSNKLPNTNTKPGGYQQNQSFDEFFVCWNNLHLMNDISFPSIVWYI